MNKQQNVDKADMSTSASISTFSLKTISIYEHLRQLNQVHQIKHYKFVNDQMSYRHGTLDWRTWQLLTFANIQLTSQVQQ